jgi:6-carboxyhexanoate--CoA ligase
MISVRMRAELKGLHVSGAERIVDEGRVERVIKELLKRPKDYDKMVITLERLEEISLIPKASYHIQLRLMTPITPPGMWQAKT